MCIITSLHTFDSLNRLGNMCLWVYVYICVHKSINECAHTQVNKSHSNTSKYTHINWISLRTKYMHIYIYIRTNA